MRKNFRIPLRVNVLTIFVTLFMAAILFIITLISVRSSQSLLYISDKLISQVTNTISEQLTSHLGTISLTSQLSANLLQDGTLQADNRTQIKSYVFNTLQQLPNAAMVYWGDEKGNFTIVRRLPNKQLELEMINRNTSQPSRSYQYFNQQGKFVRATTSQKIDYDPRQRPWYLGAKKHKKFIWSNVYLFYSGGNKILGMTAAAPVYAKSGKLLGVFGIDVKLDALSKFLAQHRVGKEGIAFIVSGKGKVIAIPGMSTWFAGQTQLPNIDSVKVPWVVESYKQYKKLGKYKFTYTYKGEDYVASYAKHLMGVHEQWTIAVVVPENEFVGKLKESHLAVLGFSVFILVLGIYLISLFAKNISAPIVRLAEETEKIKLFNLEGKERLHSYIKEIDFMSEAIDSMRHGLRAFQKYVPEALVKDLMDKRQVVRLGGRKKEITTMFADVTGFTSIAERVDPKDLMQHLCNYFNHMSSIIRKRGMLDKYIGDAFMAFWGAPMVDRKHSYHACYAALKCQEKVQQLNAKWIAEGKVPLPTRIGLHTGKAIVGNLGSSEQMGYTALGDVINIASRLEVLNKTYHTKIIISQQLKEKVDKYFYCRILDYVAVKGKTTATRIYELVGVKDNGFNDEHYAYCSGIEKAFAAYQAQQWNEAITHYKDYQKHFPDDYVSELMIARCRAFKKKPPQKNWRGVWRYEDEETRTHK